VKRIDKEYKEFFHHQSLPVAWPDDPHLRSYAEFIDACGAMTRMAKDVVMTLTSRLEEAELLPDDGEMLLSTVVARSNAVTRILRYPPLPAARGNHAEAFAHFDRSFMTVHWWASHEGLSIFDRVGRAHRVAECRWDRIAVFPGKKFFGLTHGAHGPLGIPAFAMRAELGGMRTASRWSRSYTLPSLKTRHE
jgi:isopenicillin N synthase-like dioxygenase